MCEQELYVVGELIILGLLTLCAAVISCPELHYTANSHGPLD